MPNNRGRPLRGAAAGAASKYPDLHSQYEALQEERESLQRKIAPLREKRERIREQIQPLEKQERELNERIRELEQPRLAELDNAIGGLARAMGGRALNEDTR